MGRFLIIRVIKEHNADGYQNYDKWQCPGTWTSLYTLHPLLLYRYPRRTPVQKINSPKIVQTEQTLLLFVLHLSYKLSSAVTDSAVVCIQEPAIWDRGPVFKGPILGRATFGPCTLSNPYPQQHTGSLAKHHIFCEYGICGA